MILLIDNYDSFVHNLARYFRELGESTLVRRNDEITLDEMRSLSPSHIVVSPGPRTPNEAGVSNEVIRTFGPRIPTLGVCLGHQCLAAALGGRVVRGRPMHGKTSLVEHDGSGIFASIPSPFPAARYHSLVVDREDLPVELAIVATSADGEIMALRHRTWPAWGVQFHPESVLTENGYSLLRNFVALGVRAAA